MSTGMFSTRQLRSLVDETWSRDASALALGIHVASGLGFPPDIDCPSGRLPVVVADTVFQVREALLESEQTNRKIVLLTHLSQAELGHDVVGRLARSKLFSLNPWANLCSLFKAKQMDRSVCEPALIQALLEAAPPDGYPPVPTGVLDGGTLWRAACRHLFDLGEREPELATLLVWAADPLRFSRYLRASQELQEALQRRLVQTLGEAAASVLRFVAGPVAGDALALAICCQVVFGREDERVLEAAAARLEQYHAQQPIPAPIGRSLARAAEEAITELDREDDPLLARKQLQRADELLRQLRCDDELARSSLTRLGYEQRLARFGEQLLRSLASGSEIDACERSQAEIASHRWAHFDQRAAQVARTAMALRLVRWLAREAPAGGSLAELVDHYRQDGAFADWARESVCRGEDVPQLTEAYAQLDQAALRRREQFNQDFARELAGWTAIGSSSDGLLGVEQVLTQVLAPVAQAGNRVLLIVLDGMSWAVCHELLEDIRGEHWFEATLDESAVLPQAVIAAIPSVTACSRASLLSGALTRGDSSSEKQNFEAHPVLRQTGDKRYPPVLFHKREVTDGSRGFVSQDLEEAILSPQKRIVGLVINAIDDELGGSQQTRRDWRLDRISLLSAVLRLARDTGRVVVLASDHGHVWHRPDAQFRSRAEGNRWRAASDELAPEEILLSGPRVLGSTDNPSLCVPWSERLYYGTQQNGYHGGASPQEMLCPLVLLSDKPSSAVGLFPCEFPKPEWWTAAPVATPPDPELTPVVATLRPKRPASLFDQLTDEPPVRPATPTGTAPESSAGGAWIERLFASPTYQARKDFVRRHAPDDATVRQCLNALISHGGLLTPAAFCHATQIVPSRLDGLVAQIQRLLNVDGYEILAFSRAESRIELNVPKLKGQFELE